MSTNSINSQSISYLQSILSSALQSAKLKNSQSGTGVSSTAASPSTPTDSSNLSPFSQVLSALQQLEQSDPTKYQQVAQQIAADLQSAAQTAQSDGNSKAAAELTQLAKDFTSAAKTGQLPSVQDLAKAIGGHHHHSKSAQADSDGDGGAQSLSAANSSNSAGQTQSTILSAFQTNGSKSDGTNPLSIILNTLSSAGLSVSNG
jgi:hypothetical protein